ncbi:hypothetical protein PIB30_088403, partial [Stylosanthes scabra]|nr:hypothetical protein [Stylosanthes scabra]
MECPRENPAKVGPTTTTTEDCSIGNVFEFGNNSGGSNDNNQAHTSKAPTTVEVKDNSNAHTTKAGITVEWKDKLSENTHVHTSKAATNEEAKAGIKQGNWIEVKRNSKAKTGGQVTHLKKKNFPSKSTKGM